MLTYEEATELFYYSEGRVYRRKSGKLADNHTDSKGYRDIFRLGKYYRAHRLIWLLLKGYWPKDMLNHINLNKLDNRIENLEECSCAENHQRRGIQKNNTSGVRGVGHHNGRWCAKIKLGGEWKTIGYFKHLEDAKIARKEAEIEHFGRVCP